MEKKKGMSIREMLEMAIKNELESKRAYGKFSDREDIPIFLKNRLESLKKAKEGHEKVVRNLFEDHFPYEDPQLPKETKKPIPDINISGTEKVEELIKQALKSEKASKEFYNELAKTFEDEEKIKVAKSLAHMEEGHQKVLEHELEGLNSLGSDYGLLKWVHL